MLEAIKANVDQLLTGREVENLLKVHAGWAAKMRLIGGGIPYLKCGRLVRYRWSDIESYLNTAQRTSTSDAGQRAA
jgi:hypothetical protein